MSKKTLDDRIENALNAFFETEPDRGHFEMTYTGSGTVLLANETIFTEKAEKWSRVLREILMFGPGTFSLFYLTLTTIFFYPSVGYSFLTYFFAVFLTYAGAGRITQFRNLAIPVTVIATAVVILSFALLILGRELADRYFWDSIYLFPIPLIAAKLVQSWIAEK